MPANTCPCNGNRPLCPWCIQVATSPGPRCACGHPAMLGSARCSMCLFAHEQRHHELSALREQARHPVVRRFPGLYPTS